MLHHPAHHTLQLTGPSQLGACGCAPSPALNSWLLASARRSTPVSSLSLLPQQVARYCCRECQVEDWRRGHKGVCGEVGALCAGGLPSS